MNQFLKFFAVSCLLIFSFFFFNRSAAAQTSFSDNSEKLSALAGGGIGGAWQLNSAESDDPLQKMQELIQNNAASPNVAEKSDVKQKQLPPLTTSIFHPDTLILADSGDDRMTINEGFKEIVQTRSIFADGKTRTFELSPGADYTVTAVKDAGKMTVETISPRGNKMIETYEIEPGGKKLRVTLRIENAAAKELITLHRTYDRTTVDIFSNDSGEMQ